MAKRMKEKNEKNSSKLIFNIFIVIVFLVLVGGVFYLSPNYIREDYDGKTKVLINNNNVTMQKQASMKSQHVRLQERIYR